MKKAKTPPKPAMQAPVPELRAAMESVNSIIEVNRSTRSKVKSISAMTTAILAPLLENS